MIIAMRTVFIALLIACHVFPERLLALLANERHLRRLPQLVRLSLGMTLGTVIPLLAARCTYGYLGVKDVLAGIDTSARRYMRCVCSNVPTNHMASRKAFTQKSDVVKSEPGALVL